MGLIAWAWAKLCGRPYLDTPEAVTRFVMANYEQLQPKDWQKLEGAVSRHRKGHGQALLLYALRVSKAVPGLVKLEALSARWATAHSGAGGAGLIIARNEPLAREVADFLTVLYRERLRHIYKVERDAYNRRLSVAKSEKAKEVIEMKWRDWISNARCAFAPKLEGLEEIIEMNPVGRSTIPEKPPERVVYKL